jgi:hypothetical protein
MSRQKPPMSKLLSEIAQRRGLPKRVAHRIVEMDAMTGELSTIDEVMERFRRADIGRLLWLIELMQTESEKADLSEQSIRELEGFTFGFIASPSDLPSRPGRAKIQKLLKEFASGIRRLIRSDNHESWQINLSSRKFSIQIDWVGAPHASYIASDWQDAVRMGVARLIGEHGGLLKICDRGSCGRIFLGARSRDRYCSPACSLKERQAKFRKTRSPEELIAMRREAYWRHLERTQGKATARRARENYLRRSEKEDGSL